MRVRPYNAVSGCKVALEVNGATYLSTRHRAPLRQCKGNVVLGHRSDGDISALCSSLKSIENAFLRDACSFTIRKRIIPLTSFKKRECSELDFNDFDFLRKIFAANGEDVVFKSLKFRVERQKYAVVTHNAVCETQLF